MLFKLNEFMKKKLAKKIESKHLCNFFDSFCFFFYIYCDEIDWYKVVCVIGDGPFEMRGPYDISRGATESCPTSPGSCLLIGCC